MNNEMYVEDYEMHGKHILNVITHQIDSDSERKTCGGELNMSSVISAESLKHRLFFVLEISLILWIKLISHK